MNSQFATNAVDNSKRSLSKRIQQPVFGKLLLAAVILLAGSALEAKAQDFRPPNLPPTESGFALLDQQSQGPVARTAGLVGDTAGVNTGEVIGTAQLTTSESAAPLPSPQRLTDLLRRGGLLMIPIGICSFILVVFVFERFISLRKGRIIPEPFTKKFLDQLREGQLSQNAATAICDRNNSAMANVFKAGVAKWGRPSVEVEQAVLDEGERTSNRLRKYLRLINGVATICPLLGLLGTVFGMIHAFDSIAVVNSAGADQAALTATGISQALLTTAAGLSVAIPALIAYLFFSSRVDKHVMEIDTYGMKVVNQISAEALAAKPAARKSRKAA